MTLEQRGNRILLATAMQRHGFRPYSKEWWHFTLRNEPFPDTYFDFLVQ
jgi:D-alanyl-D-alanine dipeptidase